MTVARDATGDVVPWPAELARRYREAGTWGRQTIGQALTTAADSWGSREAVWTPDRSMTYAELDERTDRLAVGLARAGMLAGDRVLLQLDNRMETVLLWYALLKAGVIPVCTLTLHRHHEIAAIAEQTRAVGHAVVAGGKFDLVSFAQEIAASHDHLRTLVVIGGGAPGGALSFDELEAGVDAEAARAEVQSMQADLDPDDVAVFQLSGGTTSVPKVIPRAHAEYWSNAQAYAGVLGWDESVRVAHPFPLVHNAGIVCGLHAPHSVGGTLVLGHPQDHFDLILNGKATDTILMAPALKQYQASEQWPQILDQLHRAILSLGTPSQQAFDDLEHGGVRVVQLFGMGEGPFLVTPPNDPAAIRQHTVGRPILPHDEVRVLDPDTGVEVEDGEEGELCFAGSSTIRGYYASAEHNKRAFTDLGLLRTGDLARWREFDGVRGIAITGRLKEMINRGGEKINAPEVEGLLLQHPRVLEAAVVPMPDERLIERACAYVVVEGPLLDLTEIQEHLAALGVAKFKWPERLEHVDRLPRTSVGKISKVAMAADIREKVEAERTETPQSR